MKTRIIARFLVKEGYNEINDREVDIDEYVEIEVKSIEEGRKLITDRDLNGCGTIFEEMVNEYGVWDAVREIQVDSGKIYCISRLNVQ